MAGRQGTSGDRIGHPDALGAAYEARLPASRRRSQGSHYTAPALADRLSALAIAGPAAVCDPACGGGAFLLAAGRRLESLGVERRHVARHLLWGADIDPEAVATTGAAVEAWAGVAPDAGHLVVADSLASDPPGWTGRFGVVLGNPPFLSQLAASTARDVAARRRLRARFGDAALGYADSAWLFLLVGLDLAGPGGQVLLIQPQSLLAADHAGQVRRVALARADLEGLWWCDEPVFAANVRVCAPLLRRRVGDGHGSPPLPPGSRGGAGAPAATPIGAGSVRRWSGPSVAARASAPAPPEPPAPGAARSTTWSSLVTHGGVPEVDLGAGTGVVGDIATATAGFRDQFYGLAPFVVDRREGDGHRYPKLVTSGLLDPAHCRWGDRPVRFAGKPWQAPRVDRAGLAAENPRLAAWVDARLVPKVVLATQTKVLEAAVDPDGTWVPSVPVIAVHAAGERLWALAAVLLAPPISAWALTGFRGAALSSDAIKLSARQVMAIPLPSDGVAWAAAAELLRHGGRDALREAGVLMNRAYGAPPEVLAWWEARIPSGADRRHSRAAPQPVG